MKALRSLAKFSAAATLALFVLAFAATPATALAQVRGSVKLQPVNTAGDLQKVEAGDIVLMSCPKCKDTYATVAVATLKGHKLEELKTLASHLCPTCETKFTFDGKGKLSDSKLVHSCKTCGSEDVSCCVLKKGSLPTSGMEEKK